LGVTIKPLLTSQMWQTKLNDWHLSHSGDSDIPDVTAGFLPSPHYLYSSRYLSIPSQDQGPTDVLGEIRQRINTSSTDTVYLRFHSAVTVQTTSCWSKDTAACRPLLYVDTHLRTATRRLHSNLPFSAFLLFRMISGGLCRTMASFSGAMAGVNVSQLLAKCPSQLLVPLTNSISDPPVCMYSLFQSNSE
jgi:hypothetical protein